MGFVEEPDGTRVYDNAGRTRYKPKTGKRYRKLKPPDAEARGYKPWSGKWLPPLPVLPEEERVVPWTRPDSEAIEHHHVGCKCRMCTTVPRVKRKKRDRVLGYRKG